MNENGKPNGRVAFIEIMRMVFCLIIMLFHMRKLGNGTPVIFTGGYIGVEFFFLVSGYLMAQTAVKSQDSRPIGTQTAAFLYRKIRAIYPYYFTAFVFAFIGWIICKDATIQEAFKQLSNGIWELLLLKRTGLGGTIWINGPTWYLSAMFTAMLLLYPLLRGYTDLFLKTIAPVLTIVCLALLYKNGSLQNGNDLFGVEIRSVLRAIGGLSLGCICYEAALALRGIRFTRVGTELLTLTELGGYGFAIYMANRIAYTQYDYTILIALAVGVTISFSQTSITGRLRYGKLCNWLSKASLLLYLNHRAIHVFVSTYLENWSYWRIVPIFLFGSIALACVCKLTVDGVRRSCRGRHWLISK